MQDDFCRRHKKLFLPTVQRCNFLSYRVAPASFQDFYDVVNLGKKRKTMTKNIHIPHPTNEGIVQLERRKNTTDRRKTEDRRSMVERRVDSRLSSTKKRKTIKIWLRTMTHSRLGVDRRKNGDRRQMGDRRRQPSLSSILTREELNDLLS